MSLTREIYVCQGGPLDGLAIQYDGLTLGAVITLALTTRKVIFAKNYAWPVYDWATDDLIGSVMYSADGPLLRYVGKVQPK